jgi:hypothetical protein
MDKKHARYQGTQQLLSLFKDFEKSWIDAQVLDVNALKKSIN